MSDHVTVILSKPVFERLQKHASPLVDTIDTVIERLLDSWESGQKDTSTNVKSNSIATQQLWKSSRGDVLPVGKELKGVYFDKSYTATVEKDGIRFNGHLYDSLSSAAIAAKHVAGTSGSAANTNGRDFWKIQDTETNQWVSVSVLRPIHRISADKLLAELNSM